jgi:hypothetical protein
MLEKIPSHEDIEKLIGCSAVAAWDELIEYVVANYELESIWDDGGKHAIWEVKYRRSGKTLCAFYVKDGYFTILIVFGKSEREKFELRKGDFSSEVVELYENTHQYHDGRWLWVYLKDQSLVEDVKKLIVIKKKPKKASL